MQTPAPIPINIPLQVQSITSGGSVTTTNIPPALTVLPAGTILKGNVAGRDPNGNTLLRTENGTLVLSLGLTLKRGVEMTIRLDKTQEQMFAKIITIDGKSVPKYLESQQNLPVEDDVIISQRPLTTSLSGALQTELTEEPLAPFPQLRAILLSATAPLPPGTARPEAAAQQTLPQLPPSLESVIAQGKPGTALLIEIRQVQFPETTQTPLPAAATATATAPGTAAPAPTVTTTLPPTAITTTAAAPLATPTSAPTTPLAANAPSPSPLIPMATVTAPAAPGTPQTSAAPPGTPTPSPTAATIPPNTLSTTAPSLAASPLSTGAAPLSNPLISATSAPVTQPLPAATPQTLQPASTPAAPSSPAPTPQANTAQPASPHITSTAAPPPPPQANAPTAPALLQGIVVGESEGDSLTIQTSIGLARVMVPQPLPAGTRILFQLVSATLPTTDGDDVTLISSTPTSSAKQESLLALQQMTYPATGIGASPNPIHLLPRPGSEMTTELFFLMTAIKGGSVRKWLESQPKRELEKLGEAGIGKLQQDFGNLRGVVTDTRDQTQWNLYTLPIMTGQGLEQAKLYYRDPREEASAEGKKSEESEHFVFDITFSKLGHMQFDGLVQRPEKNKLVFDLTVRSTAQLSVEMKQHIRSIYLTTQEVSGFSGSVTFHNGRDACLPLDTPQPGADFNASSILA